MPLYVREYLGRKLSIDLHRNFIIAEVGPREEVSEEEKEKKQEREDTSAA